MSGSVASRTASRDTSEHLAVVCRLGASNDVDEYPGSQRRVATFNPTTGPVLQACDLTHSTRRPARRASHSSRLTSYERIGRRGRGDTDDRGSRPSEDSDPKSQTKWWQESIRKPLGQGACSGTTDLRPNRRELDAAQHDLRTAGSWSERLDQHRDLTRSVRGVLPITIGGSDESQPRISWRSGR